MSALPPNTPAEPTPPSEPSGTPSYNVPPPGTAGVTPAAAPAAEPVAPTLPQPAPPAPVGDAPAPAAPVTPTAPPAQPAPPAPGAASTSGSFPPPPPGAPTAAPAQAPADALPNIQVNYWLSVFFTWVPALIFYFIEKDKGQSLAWRYHVANLNFSLVRTIVSVGAFVFAGLPFLGELLSVLLGIASFVLFVFHIIAAVKATNNYRAGKEPEFIFNFPMVK